MAVSRLGLAVSLLGLAVCRLGLAVRWIGLAVGRFGLAVDRFGFAVGWLILTIDSVGCLVISPLRLRRVDSFTLVLHLARNCNGHTNGYTNG